MELYELIEVVKVEYEMSKKAYKETCNQYWYGRMCLANEVLKMSEKLKSNRINFCTHCELTSEGCRKCFE